MKLELTKQATSNKILAVFIRDSSKTNGAGLTGLVFGSSGLTAYYWREGDATATAITLATMTLGTYASGGFKEMDATNMPGWYSFCPPNAAFLTGANNVAFHLKGATNMVDLPIEIQLNNFDLQTAGVTVTTNNDKTGYALTAGERTAISTALVGTALTELAQAQPSATPTVNDALMLPFMDLRNGGTTGSGTETVLNSAGTVIAKRAYTDDGTTLTVNKMVTGP